jgi:hypothetical protein
MKLKIPKRTGKSIEFKLLINESISVEFILIFYFSIYYLITLVNIDYLQKNNLLYSII